MISPRALDYAALGWVKPELDEVLGQVRSEIEAFAEDPDGASHLRICIAQLHQVQGTLQMLELDAPARVAAEMEALARALQDSGAGDHEAACTLLLRGAVLLPDYLERLQGGHRDIPIVLLPLINELRAARGEGAVDESVLFEGVDDAPASAAELEHAHGSISGRNRALLDTVAAAIKDDLLQVKDALDLQLRGSRGDIEGLRPQAQVLARVGDTLDMLGLPQARDVVHAQHLAMQRIVDGTQPADETALMDMAAALLQVENALDEHVQRVSTAGDDAQGDARDAVQAIAREVLVNFAAAREACVAFVETGWDHARLAPVPGLLDEVAGALRMLERDDAADCTVGLRRFVSGTLLNARTVPASATLDTFADALTAVEYHIESLRHPGGNRDASLHFARERLEQLGQWPLAANDDALATYAPQDATSDAFDAQDAHAHVSNAAVLQDAETPSVAQDAHAGQPVDAVNTAAPLVGSELASASSASARDAAQGGFEATGEAIDDEIREVFLEELQEEIDNLGTLLPSWAQQPEDMERLRPIRRVFHTLKGSGRLVGAKLLGEFSWKIENMLNRVLDGTRAPSTAVVAVVERAHAVLPQLESALRGQGVISADLDGLQSVADRIATGEEVPLATLDVANSHAQSAQVDAATAQTQHAEMASAAIASDEPPHADSALAHDEVPASVDPVLLEILEAEVDGHLATVERWLDQARQSPQADEPLLRALHTMNGAFAMTEVPGITDVLTPAEAYAKRLLVAHGVASAEGIAALAAVPPAVRATLAGLRQTPSRARLEPDLVQRLVDVRDSLPDAPLHVLDPTPSEPAELPSLDAAGLAGIETPQAIVPIGSVDADSEGVPDAAQLAREADLLESERVAAETLEAERIAAEAEAERIAAEKAQAERVEAERIAAEQAEVERVAVEQAESERLEAERLAAEQAESERLEAERLAAETAEAERVEAERLAAAQAEAERVEAGRVVAEKAEAERVAVEQQAQAEREAAEQAEAERVEAERVAAEKAEAERLTAEKAEAERVEAERVAAEQAEAERVEAERVAAEQAEAERVEAERVAAEQAEAGRVAAEKAEADRVEAERVAAEQAEAQRIEAERLAAEKAEAERIAAGKAEAERIEAERIAAEKAEAARLAAERAEAERVAAEQARLAQIAEAARSQEDPDEALDTSDLDQDLLDIFVEESGDLLDHSDALLAQLRATPGVHEPVAGLQRDLHTLKGGARMAGIMAVGELGHAMESLLDALSARHGVVGTDQLPLLERGFDRLHAMVVRVGARRAIGMPGALIAEFEQHARGSEATPAIELKPLSAPIGDDAGDDDTAPRAPQEQVRIRADLLDRLVNYAGEVAIYRARLEQQLGAFRAAMREMEQTNTRLRDQLRRLDSETEAQIVARFQREKDVGDATFDPLELDRFSTLQQLSRGLTESAADMASLQGTLDDLTRQYETLLLQQSRVSSDLQEGLMRTRMLPFDTLLPRLRRIVRQAAGETGKQAQLALDSTHGELDRNVLERMTAPLEHMLRNAVAHGLETPDARRAANKPEEGTVRIGLRREGSEVVLEIADDGTGLDREAIRRRGIERGLLREDAVLGDHDLDALILEPGFSTADSVSRLAGRGVGMDVVASEVRQLGGTLDIASRQGMGTTFTLRLPQTLAVTQATFVRIGETSFAVPIASVRGVGRIARDDAAQPGASYAYGGEDYVLHDLGRLLGQPPARADGQLQLPLLLIRAGELRAAIVVDQILGNREIVVKPVGPQVASIPGIFGATIMGDGSVVVILDVAPLVRRIATAPREIAPAPTAEQRRVPLVMVVDDSITMRKVTGRVLERHNLEVVTAKDGVDAIERLDERIPDLMLLDIEMPRMDGYELATHMRANPRWRNVPIVMITSRTGDKHRQRALELGVQRYLGKPYQEPELMRNVFELLGLEKRGE